MRANIRLKALRAFFYLSVIASLSSALLAQKNTGGHAAAPAAPRAQTAAPANRQMPQNRQQQAAQGRQNPQQQRQNLQQRQPQQRQNLQQRQQQNSGLNRQGFGNRSEGRGQVSRLAGGGTRETRADGSMIDRNAAGRATSIRNPSHGWNASVNPRTGRVNNIRQTRVGNNTMIHRGPMNERRVEQVRSVPGGIERINHYGNWSSIQRPMVGRPGYVQRTVFVGGRSYSGVYRSYPYHGIVLFSPVPALVFAPAFYGWMITPWGAPIVYPPAYWGFAGQPWFGVYGPAFAPYPVYNSPDQWLTDYVISSDLQQGYMNQQAVPGGEPPPSLPPMSEQDKQIMNQDLRNDLSNQQQFANQNYNAPTAGDNAAPPPYQQQQTSSAPAPAVPEALQDHMFTVFQPIQAHQLTGEECDLTALDTLYRRDGNNVNTDNTVNVEVKRSHASPTHPDYCAAHAQVKVDLLELQEIHNHKIEAEAAGLKKESALAGNRLPKSPAPRPSQVAQGQTDPATQQDIADMKQMLADADRTESEVSVVGTTGTTAN